MKKFRVWNQSLMKMYYVGDDIALQFGNNGCPKDDKSPKPMWDLFRCTPNWPDALASDKNGDVLMQYLNFDVKDKVELFEGDIVRYPDIYKVRLLNKIRLIPSQKEKEDCYVIGEVFFNDGCTWVRRDGSMQAISWMMSYTGNVHDPVLVGSSFEVIGNIYENPELLK